MKICPKCNTQYKDGMSFCPDDAERLVSFDAPLEGTLKTENIKLAVSENRKTTSSIYEPKFENNISQPKLRSNLLIGLFIGILLLLGIFIGSWGYNPYAGLDESPTPTPIPDLNTSATEDVSDADMKSVNEVFYEGLKNKLLNSASKNGLKSLAATSLPKDSAEIRLYLFASFYGPIYKGISVDESVLVLKKDGSNWSGNIIRNVIKPNSTKEKIVTPLNQPVSGWEALWQKLQDNGVFAPPEKSETSIKSDTTLYVIETKENGKYNYFYFHVPKEKSANNEQKRVAAIFNLIAKEFDASDMKAS